MAKRRSPKMIPADYSIGKNVFPIVPFRTAFGTIGAAFAGGVASVVNTTDATIVAGNVGQEVELDLDFESNEVFDVMMIDAASAIFISPTGSTNTEDMLNVLALTDDPDKANSTAIHTEAIFETDESFVWYWYDTLQHYFSADANDVLRTTGSNKYVFEQPWTVARNLKWIFSSSSSDAAAIATNVRIQLWGRRRNASDEEFKSIIYRQRF